MPDMAGDITRGTTCLNLLSKDAEDTRRLGEALGGVAEAGDVLLLDGPFGAGKTVFVQGLAAGLGVSAHVGSPSYIMINEHRGRHTLFHIDLYRMEGRLDLEALDTLAEYLDSDGVCAVEWPGPVPAELRLGATDIRFEPMSDSVRRIHISTSSPVLAAAARQAGARD